MANALTFRRVTVEGMRAGDVTAVIDGVLSVAVGELVEYLCGLDTRIEAAQVSLACPGDSTRIVCVKDVVQARTKLFGTMGEGETLVLDGAGIATCGPIVGFQEGVIDMSGPGAAYTPFSALHLIVLLVRVVEGLGPHEHEEVLRQAGLAAAGYVARACAGAAAFERERIEWDPQTSWVELPRIGYIGLVLSQGLLHDTYVLNRNASQGLPMVINPLWAIDGAIVSGNCVSACDKTTTYHHQNNPVTMALLRGHGTRWHFAGNVLSNVPTRLDEKERSAAAAVALATELEPAGVIVTKEGFGNPDTDLMMIIGALERRGFAAVAISDEFAGSAGDSQSLADSTPEADAIISTGNANQRLHLPAMMQTIGPLPDAARLSGGYAYTVRDDGTFEIEVQAIMGATNQLGFSRLTCREI